MSKTVNKNMETKGRRTGSLAKHPAISTKLEATKWDKKHSQMRPQATSDGPTPDKKKQETKKESNLQANSEDMKALTRNNATQGAGQVIVGVRRREASIDSNPNEKAKGTKRRPVSRQQSNTFD